MSPSPYFEREGHNALTETQNIDTTQVVTAPSRSFKINKKINSIYSPRSPDASGKSSKRNSQRNSPKSSLYGSNCGETTPNKWKKPSPSLFARLNPSMLCEITGKQPSKFQDQLPARLAMGTPDATAQRQKLSMYLKKEDMAENIFVINNSPKSVVQKKRSMSVSYSPIVTKKGSETNKPPSTINEAGFRQKRRNSSVSINLTLLTPKNVLTRGGTCPNKLRKTFFSETKESSIERKLKFKDLVPKFCKIGGLITRPPLNMKNKTATDSFGKSGFSQIRKCSNFSSTDGKGREIWQMNLTTGSFVRNNTSVGDETS